MGYRDDLIERLKQEGQWDRVTGEQQRKLESLTHDEVRQLMIMQDEWDMGDKRTIELFGLVSVVQMIMSFKGALVEIQGERIGRLSRAGRLLAEFFEELRDRGLSSNDVDNGLGKLTPLVIAALTTVYERTGNDGMSD